MKVFPRNHFFRLERGIDGFSRMPDAGERHCLLLNHGHLYDQMHKMGQRCLMI